MPHGYQESDRDFVLNNFALARNLLDLYGRGTKGIVTPADIKILYNLADDALVREVERRVRIIMEKNPNIKEFCMAMGSATFHLTKPVTTKDRYGVGMYCEDEHPKYLSPFFTFLDEWDSVYHTTGSPIKLIRDGNRIVKVTNW